MRAALLCLVLAACTAACTTAPTATGTVCPTPDPTTLGYDTQFDPMCTPTAGGSDGACFGKTFVTTYCTMCHSSTLAPAQRNGAPAFHDFDMLVTILDVANHIDEQAGIGPMAANHFMPPARCPSTPGGPLAVDCVQPSDAERTQLAEWMACATARTYDF